jgi:CheY-like chemotaxis protein
VLVVDDEANARGALVELLLDAGFEACEAGSGEEALTRLASFHPDVVVTDVYMGGMTGLDLGRAIGTAVGAPRVAFMSAFPPPRVAPKPWLPKPLDLEQLFDTVERLCRERRQARAGTGK